jgi:hypothetical protein
MRWIYYGMAALAVGALPSAAADNPVTGQELSKINAVLESLNCKVKPETIQKSGDGFALDDVFCADGLFTIRLNSKFKVVAKQAV